jgi:hypothetical protein
MDTQEEIHGLINYKDTKAKCRHLKKWTYTGTSRKVFIQVSRLEIQSVNLVFLTQFYILYTSTVCSVWGGGYGVLGLRQINAYRKVPFQVNFFSDDDIFHCLL